MSSNEEADAQLKKVNFVFVSVQSTVYCSCKSLVTPLLLHFE